LFKLIVNNLELRSRLILRDSFSFQNGINWVVGPMESGKTTLLDILAWAEHYKNQGSINTNLSLPKSKVIRIDFDMFLVSDEHIDSNFKSIQKSAGRNLAKRKCLQLLCNILGASTVYKLVLIDNFPEYILDNFLEEVESELKKLNDGYTVLFTTLKSRKYSVGQEVVLGER